MNTKKAQKFPQIRITEEALKQARKVAKNRGESVSHYISSLILKKYGETNNENEPKKTSHYPSRKSYVDGRISNVNSNNA